MVRYEFVTKHLNFKYKNLYCLMFHYFPHKFENVMYSSFVDLTRKMEIFVKKKTHCQSLKIRVLNRLTTSKVVCGLLPT